MPNLRTQTELAKEIAAFQLREAKIKRALGTAYRLADAAALEGVPNLYHHQRRIHRLENALRIKGV